MATAKTTALTFPIEPGRKEALHIAARARSRILVFDGHGS